MQAADDQRVPETGLATFDRAGWADLARREIARPERLDAVHATGLLDSELETAFDRLTKLAATTLGTPWAFVTLVDERRSFWKSCFGTGLVDAADRQNTIEESFCQYVVATADTLLVEDASRDPRTDRNPSIASMGLRSWAGCPIRDANGEVLGTFCVASTEPRTWTADDAQALETLAGAATSEIRLRTALRAATDTADALAVELLARDELAVRSRLLAELAHELSSAESAIQVARIFATTGREVLGALYVNVDLADPTFTRLEIVHSPTIPDDIAARYASIEIDATTAPGEAVLRRVPTMARSIDEFAQRWPNTADVARTMGLRACAAWPMFRADGRVLGALSVGWDTDVEFRPLLRGALLTLAQMCAASIERGRMRDDRNGFLVALQRALLPPVPEVVGLDIAARYLPPNNTLGFGGDWYDLFAVGPTQVAVIVGDVCGHGIEAAAAMAQLRGSFNALARISVDSLGELFDQAEEWLPALPDFVATVAVHVLDTTTGVMRYVSAGHPPSLIVRADGSATLLEAGRRPVLGMGGRQPAVGIVQLERGDALVAYTDGLLERRGRTVDDGIAYVADVVAATGPAPAAVIADALEAAIAWSPVDDVAFTVVRRTA